MDKSSRKLLRVTYDIKVNRAEAAVIGPNSKRVGLMFGCPSADVALTFPQGLMSHNTSVAAIGVVMDFSPTVDTVITWASAILTAGAAPTIQLQSNQLLAGEVALESSTGNISQSMNFLLNAGKHMQWNVTVAGAAGTMDLTIAGTQAQFRERVTIDFARPAVDGFGIPLFAGNAPLQLFVDQIGEAIREEIHACSNLYDGLTISVVEFMEP
jgi:hypothetical protein